MPDTILDTIIKSKRRDVSALRSRQTDLRDACRDMLPGRDFRGALRRSEGGPMRLIAEVKHRSPSAGVIADPFVPADIAREYADGQADAISVLTDEKYFGGSLKDLKAVRETVALPVLRKDFLIDPVQVYESRAAGADAALLISDALSTGQLQDMVGLALDVNLAVLLESHSEDALGQALETPAKVLGINNRDLATFAVDIDTTIRLASMVDRERVLVSESGIKTGEDVQRLAEAGVQAILVGQSLLQAGERMEKMAELRLVR